MSLSCIVSYPEINSRFTNILFIVIKYYFATQNNILCVIGYKISNGIFPFEILKTISNVNGFLNILIATNEIDIKRIVYALSSVYGDNQILPKIKKNTDNV